MRVEYGVIDALTKAGVYDDVPMRRIFLMSPHDPLIQELQKEAKTRNEGFIHILRHKPLLAGVIRRKGVLPRSFILSISTIKICVWNSTKRSTPWDWPSHEILAS